MSETIQEVHESVATDLRSRILREATKLFAERGYNAASVREVVEAAGCTKPALYYYFESKDALFVETIREATSEMTRIIEGTMQSHGPIRDQLASGIDSFMGYLDANHMAMRLLMRAELQPDEGQPPFDFESVRARHTQMITAMLQSGVDQKEIRSDVDLDDAALALAGMVDQRLQLWLIGVAPPADLGRRILRIFFDGVG